MKTTKEKIVIAIAENLHMDEDHGFIKAAAQAALDVVCEELVSKDMAIKARNVFHTEYHKKGNTVLESMEEILKAAADKLRG